MVPKWKCDQKPDIFDVALLNIVLVCTLFSCSLYLPLWTSPSHLMMPDFTIPHDVFFEIGLRSSLATKLTLMRVCWGTYAGVLPLFYRSVKVGKRSLKLVHSLAQNIKLLPGLVIHTVCSSVIVTQCLRR